MPDRDYYLRTDEKFVAIRKAYTDYITRLFTLAGQKDPAGAAARILALETTLAQKQWDRARSRDRNATYNKMTLDALQSTTPNFDWHAYVSTQSRRPPRRTVPDVIVRQPDYMKAVGAGDRRDAGRDVEGVSAVRRDSGVCGRSARRIRRRALRFQRQGDRRPPGNPAALEARRGRGGRNARRAGGQALRRTLLQERCEGAHGRADQESARGVQGRHRRARVDVARDQGAGAGEARQVRGEDCVPGSLARLHGPRHRRAAISSATSCATGVSRPTRCGPGSGSPSNGGDGASRRRR